VDQSAPHSKSRLPVPPPAYPGTPVAGKQKPATSRALAVKPSSQHGLGPVEHPGRAFDQQQFWAFRIGPRSLAAPNVLGRARSAPRVAWSITTPSLTHICLPKPAFWSYLGCPFPSAPSLRSPSTQSPKRPPRAATRGPGGRSARIPGARRASSPDPPVELLEVGLPGRPRSPPGRGAPPARESNPPNHRLTLLWPPTGPGPGRGRVAGLLVRGPPSPVPVPDTLTLRSEPDPRRFLGSGRGSWANPAFVCR